MGVSVASRYPRETPQIESLHGTKKVNIREQLTHKEVSVKSSVLFIKLW